MKPEELRFNPWIWVPGGSHVANPGLNIICDYMSVRKNSRMSREGLGHRGLWAGLQAELPF